MKTVIALALIGLLLWLALRGHRLNKQVPSLGHQSGQLTPLSDSPNGVSSQATDASKRVPSLAFDQDLPSTQARLTEALAQSGYEYTWHRQDPEYWHLVFATPGLGFRDDAEFYFDAAQGQVHFRSQSRVGYSDMGLNRRRYESILHAYQALQP